MNRLTLAVALVLAGVMLVLALAVCTLVVAAFVLPVVAVWGVAAGLALGVAMFVLGVLGIDVEPRS